jgi:hypothetical protein
MLNTPTSKMNLLHFLVDDFDRLLSVLGRKSEAFLGKLK